MKPNVKVRIRTGNEQSKCQQPRSHYLHKKKFFLCFFFLQKRPTLIFFKATSLGVKSIRCEFISEYLSVNVQAGERSRTATATKQAREQLTRPQHSCYASIEVSSKLVELKLCKNHYEAPKLLTVDISHRMMVHDSHRLTSALPDHWQARTMQQIRLPVKINHPSK